MPDSAATAFSMYSGVKTNFYTMGYDSNIQVTEPSIVHILHVLLLFPVSRAGLESVHL